MPHFTEPDVRIRLVAVIEPDEAIGLQRFTKGEGVRMTKAAIRLRVVKPDVFNRPILREQFLELRLFYFRRVTTRMIEPVVLEFALGKIQCQLEAVFGA